MALTARQQYEIDQAARNAARNRGGRPAAGASGPSAAASQSFQSAIQVAQAFAQLSARSAEAANRNRLAAANRAIESGTAQIKAAEVEEKSKIAQALARHQGTLKVNAAYRGTAGSGSTRAAGMSASLLAAHEAGNVSANAAAAEARLVSENAVQLEDPRLAAIEGGLKGFSIGQQLAGSLASLGSTYVTPIRGGGDPKYGGAKVTGGDTIFSIPGIDLGRMFSSGTFDFRF